MKIKIVFIFLILAVLQFGCGKDSILDPGSSTFKDSRDKHIYKLVQIGQQVWMAENLAYLPDVSPPSKSSAYSPYYYVYDYEGTDVKEAKEKLNYTTYGTLYNWEAARTACPAGWHLPTDEEWKSLEIELGMSVSDAEAILYGRISGSVGQKLRSTSGWFENGNGDNSSGFMALPGGVRIDEDWGDWFWDVNTSAYFWSSSVDESSEVWCRSLNSGHPGVGRWGNNHVDGLSVRCVKNTNGGPNTPPKATFIVTPTSGTTITNFHFDATGCSDKETQANRLRVRWDWNDDGIWDTDYTSELTIIHLFTQAGSYTIRLEVKDVEGLTSSITQSVNVTSGSTGNGTYTDSRDGHTYNYITIGSQTWMAENLAYLPSVSPMSAGSTADPNYYVFNYEGTNVSEAKANPNYAVYGALYNWEASIVSCPMGWHLPSDEEWKIFENYLGMSQSELDLIDIRNSGIVGKKLKSISGWFDNGNGDNSSGFDALPASCHYFTGEKTTIGFNALFWSETAYDEWAAWFRSLSNDNNGVFRGYFYKSNGYSVRCLQN